MRKFTKLHVIVSVIFFSFFGGTQAEELNNKSETPAIYTETPADTETPEFTQEELQELDNTPHPILTMDDVVLPNGEIASEFCKNVPDEDLITKDLIKKVKKCNSK